VRTDDLDASRAANRDLMTHVNTGEKGHRPRPTT
jgi:hypothetical protein